MRTKRNTLGGYVDQALNWTRSQEGQEGQEGRVYWNDFSMRMYNEYNATEILEYLPNCDVWQEPHPKLDAQVYTQLQIIAKYWHRFGRLPDVELLKELKDVQANRQPSP